MPASRVVVACVYCARELDPREPGTYQRVQAWGRRKRRGASIASDLVARELLPEYACLQCVGRIRDGVDPGQLTLHDYGLVEP